MVEVRFGDYMELPSLLLRSVQSLLPFGTYRDLVTFQDLVTYRGSSDLPGIFSDTVVDLSPCGRERMTVLFGDTYTHTQADE